jgi:surface-adhesin protein E
LKNVIRGNRLNRVFLLAPFLLLALAASAHSADTPDPCARQRQATIDAFGTPKHAAATELWQACVTWANNQGKEDLVATKDAWAQSLDKLPNGGWMLLMVSDDGTFAVFGSLRHATREGDVVSVWERWEYRERQANNTRSSVVRKMYDCARVVSKPVSSASYSQSNLSGAASSNAYDERWVPVVPGSMGDSLLEWACKSTPRVQAAKAQ